MGVVAAGWLAGLPADPALLAVELAAARHRGARAAARWPLAPLTPQDQSLGLLADLMHQVQEGQAGLARRIERCKRVHGNLGARLQVGPAGRPRPRCAACTSAPGASLQQKPHLSWLGRFLGAAMQLLAPPRLSPGPPRLSALLNHQHHHRY